MTVAPRVFDALKDQYPDTLGPAGAARIRGKGPTTTVGRKEGLEATEDDERVRYSEDRGATRERQGALVMAQRLAGEVECNEGGAARGIDGNGGAPEPKAVGDTA